MKIIRDLAITREELFDYLEESLCAELARASGEHVERSQIRSGLSVPIGPGGDRIEVVSYDRPNECESLTVRGSERSRSRYVAGVSEREGRIKVTFHQEMDSFDKREPGPMKMFSEAVYLGRMAESLFSMQDRIVAAREGD